MCRRTRPSFGMTPTIHTFFINFQKQIFHPGGPQSQCHTKRRMGAATPASPSFAMTLTQAITVSTERKYTLAAKPSTQNRGGLEEK